MEILINSQPSPAPSQLRLLDLNDYCLLEIFSYLNIEDLVYTSTVCRRFEYNAERLYPHQLKLWKDVPDKFKTSQFLLSKLGFFVSEVEVQNEIGSEISTEKTVDLIDKNFTNLEKIVFNHSIPSSLLALPSTIKCITINFPENWILSVGFLEGLQKFSQLESLTLNFYHFTPIDSSFLNELPPLQTLRLENCSVEPIILQNCLQKSKHNLETLTLGNCFPQFPNILIENIDQLVKLNELGFQLNSGPFGISSSNIFKRLTSLTLINSKANIDADKLFNALIEYNKIHTLSLNSFEDIKSLKRSTLYQLHRLTNLRRLFLYESDFVTGEFLTEISRSRNLTHFTYTQTYQPMLSLDALLVFISVNGTKLENCSYMVYHDIMNADHRCAQKKELMNTFRRTDVFKRILHCKEDISCKLTSVEFVFKKLEQINFFFSY